MAILKSVYETETDIPEAVRPLEMYEEKDGKWLLKRDAIEGVKTQADFDRLTNSTKADRKAAADAAAKLKAFGDVTPEALQEQLDELETLRAEKAAGGTGDKTADAESRQKLIDAAVASQTRKLERELAKIKGERDAALGRVTELDGSIKVRDIEGQLTQAAAKHKVIGDHLDDVLARKGQFTLGDDGIARSRDGETAEEWLEELKSGGKKPGWFERSTGAGASGGNGVNLGDNPFRSGNLTKINELAKKDAAKAETQAKVAGYQSVQDAVTKIASGKPVKPGG